MSGRRGLLNEAQSLEKFQLRQFAPIPELKTYVSSFWCVQWNMPEGETYQQVNLPYPVQHVVLDPQKGSGVFGCTMGRFCYQISGRGIVLGARLYPGAANVLCDRPMVKLVDSSTPLPETFTAKTSDLEAMLYEENAPHTAIDALSAELLQVLAPLSDEAKLVRTIVELVESSPTIARVTELAQKTNVSVRQLQRLFKLYLGVTPKWVIERFRIFEALDTLNSGCWVDLAQLAARLEFTDQAHFATTFKKLTGKSPGAYAKAQFETKLATKI